MANLKHVGRITKNNRRVVVAYRVVPGEPENSIVVTTENLSADEHDSLMKLVESPAGQEANDLATVMARTSLPDGRVMLAHFHKTGKMIKVSSRDVDMIPNRNTSINLAELNEVVAQQQGVTVADLAVGGNVTKTEDTVADTANAVSQSPVEVKTDEPLTDEALATKYRSDADRLFKEAKRLREEAEKLAPTKKTTKKKAEESA